MQPLLTRVIRAARVDENRLCRAVMRVMHGASCEHLASITGQGPAPCRSLTMLLVHWMPTSLIETRNNLLFVLTYSPCLYKLGLQLKQHLCQYRLVYIIHLGPIPSLMKSSLRDIQDCADRFSLLNVGLIHLCS